MISDEDNNIDTISLEIDSTGEEVFRETLGEEILRLENNPIPEITSEVMFIGSLNVTVIVLESRSKLNSFKVGPVISGKRSDISNGGDSMLATGFELTSNIVIDRNSR